MSIADFGSWQCCIGATIVCSATSPCSHQILNCSGVVECGGENMIIRCESSCLHTTINISDINSLTVTAATNLGFRNLTK